MLSNDVLTPAAGPAAALAPDRTAVRPLPRGRVPDDDLDDLCAGSTTPGGPTGRPSPTPARGRSWRRSARLVEHWRTGYDWRRPRSC